MDSDNSHCFMLLQLQCDQGLVQVVLLEYSLFDLPTFMVSRECPSNVAMRVTTCLLPPEVQGDLWLKTGQTGSLFEIF